MTRKRIFGVGLFVLLSAASGVQAQQGYYPYSYYPNPQPYPAAVQRAQYPAAYSNNYPGGGAAYYNAPRASYVPTSSYNGNGVTYYYVQNPNGPNYYPLTSPYGTPPSLQRLPSQPTNWPAPASLPSEVEPEVRPAAPPLPPLPFHRPTNETFWFKGDYLASFIRPMRINTPLATTGSAADPAAGALGQPSTAVLYGNHSVDFNMFSGIRLEGGLFLDSSNCFSLEMGGFFLMPNTQSYSTASDANGNPLITRPFLNVATGKEASLVTAEPNTLAGTLSITNRSEMSGVEFNGRYHVYVNERLHADALVGLRYLRLSEQTQIRDQIMPLTNNFLAFQGNAVNAPNSLSDQDNFSTLNQFFGPQVGARLSWESRWFTVSGFSKLGVGVTQQQTSINGSTTMVTPAGNQSATGGILALPSNIGTHNRTVVGIVPEMGLNFGVDLTQCVRLNLGYSMLLWNHVVRPGNQIDRNINPGQIPGSPTFGQINGPVGPTYRFNDEFFWAQSFNVGLEVHY